MHQAGSKTWTTVATAAFVAASFPAFAAPLKQEPAMGSLREGEVVLVDDGSCPAGQIKRVVGGNHIKVGGTKQIVRQSSCVRR